MAFGVANQSLPGRGPTPGLRFIGYAVLAITLMFVDRREGWMEQVRFALQTAMYPLQLAVSSPGTAWGWIRESSRTRERLREENTDLRTRLRDLELRTMRYEALSQENATLRGLRTALPPVAEKWLIAEIVQEPDSRRPRLLINRGSSNGVFKGQAVMDDYGIIGQTTHVGPWSAEVILITDPEHAIPVQVERTGVRTIALGTGGSLGLSYLPANADLKVGDVLLTSGMGGVFPQGYPLGKVTELNREAVRPVERFRAEPLARINSSREVMLVWFREAHPAAPVRDTDTLTDLPKGDPNSKAQPTPKAPLGAPGSAAPGGAAPGTTPGPQRPGTATAPANRPTTGGAGPRQTVPLPAPTPARSGTGSVPANATTAPRNSTAAPTAPPSTTPPQPTTPPAENRE
jgi:rod shape-determining protein MreC